METERMNVAKQLLLDALNFARCSRDIAARDPEDEFQEDKASALAYAAACTAKYSAAQAIYAICPEYTVSPSGLFSAFSTFVQEVFSDYAEDHSRQQVLICYDELESCYKDMFSDS